MSERDAILARVRAGARRRDPHPGSYAAPALPADWTTFSERLRSVGGEPYGPIGRADLADTVERLVAGWAGGGVVRQLRVSASRRLKEPVRGSYTRLAAPCG